MKVLLLFLLTFNVYAECVHEYKFLGSHLFDMNSGEHKVMILSDDERFIDMDLVHINPLELYTVQLVKEKEVTKNLGDFDRYNQKYIEYYQFRHMQTFLNSTQGSFNNHGYSITTVGKSLEGRDLYAVKPKFFDSDKKTILMFGRHHGDEGTANWIIEGFIQEFLNAPKSFHDEYQLLLYPMVNPDGAQAQTRYNKNGRDLNRSWHFDLNQSYDEAAIIHKDLKKYLKQKQRFKIVLDMHGSFTQDFIYRVKRNYVSEEFYNRQQEFIDELGSWDKFQNGNFQLSNGHPKMARLVMINAYNLNALTHETPRDIKLKNSKNRSKSSLMEQGKAVFESILKLY